MFFGNQAHDLSNRKIRIHTDLTCAMWNIWYVHTCDTHVCVYAYIYMLCLSQHVHDHVESILRMAYANFVLHTRPLCIDPPPPMTYTNAQTCWTLNVHRDTVCSRVLDTVVTNQISTCTVEPVDSCTQYSGVPGTSTVSYYVKHSVNIPYNSTQTTYNASTPVHPYTVCLHLFLFYT